MGALWYECREFDAFPVRCRAWRRWCASGPKHKGGTSIGGGHLFRMLRRSLQHRPVGDANYWPVPSVRLDRPLYVDLLDLQSYIHTVPILSRGSNEFNLQKFNEAEYDKSVGRCHVAVHISQNRYAILRSGLALPAAATTGALYSYSPGKFVF